MFKIATWNVNSIRKRILQVLELLEKYNIDILLLQETKCQNDVFPIMEIQNIGYHAYIHGQKAFNGVAILSRYEVKNIQLFFSENENDPQARYIEGDIKINNIIYKVASVYVPNGQDFSSEAFQYKLNFLDKLYVHMEKFHNKMERYIIGGDFNIAPYPIDVHSKMTDNTVCYSEVERKNYEIY